MQQVEAEAAVPGASERPSSPAFAPSPYAFLRPETISYHITEATHTTGAERFIHCGNGAK